MPEAFKSLTALRYAMLAGQPFGAGLHADIRRHLGELQIFNAYGCTENGPRVTVNAECDPDTALAGILPVGRAVRGTRVAILAEDGSQLAAGEYGEVAVGGTSLMRGYLGHEAETAGRMVDGLFRTRDRGMIDANGLLHISGRIDHVILVGQQKVSPEELEEAIRGQPGIVDVAVAALPDAALVQVPLAFIVVDGDERRIIEGVRSHVAKTLSRYKQPRLYRSVGEIPRTSNGKIDRAALRELVAAMEDGRGGGR